MITKEDVKYLEGLAKIELTEDKRELYIKQIGDILEYIEDIQNISSDGFEIVYEHKNIFREDEADLKDEHTQKAIANSPDHIGDLFKVSQVIKQ